ncbi:MipA/OmpV family protein [Thalassotalea fonticola]|uniref:MipA/OmpV family protein n=1 Tax=Thalassotalea fonticola TaxID=3065649 RepID=A0ABZ0GS07_9GAMM|nr:MipA/OmpV family protein [Colwelliaceae bacterium S1-1]
MKKLLVTSLLLASTSAMAGGSGVAGSVSDVPDTPTEAKSGWKASVGLGVVNAPTFAGVDDTESTGVPLINVSYNDTFYFEYNKLGWWAWKPQDTGFRVGLVAQSRKGYDRGDGPWIEHEVDDTGLAGVRAQWKSGMFKLDASLLASSEEDSGGEMHITASYTFLASAKGTLTGMVKAESLSEDSVNYFYYGANANSGDPLFSGGESTTNVSVGLIGTYNIAPQWTLIGAVLATSYGDAISDAPTNRGTGMEDSGTTALVGATYTF